MSRSEQATKQRRDEHGRFAKLDDAIYIANGVDPLRRHDLTSSLASYRKLNDELLGERVNNIRKFMPAGVMLLPPFPRVSRWSRAVRFISHNRMAIGYVLLCLAAGLLGGYIGVKVGL